MDAAWQVLVRWGLPDGAAQAAALPRGAAPDPAEPRAALAEVLAGDLDARARELLLAWLDAFAHHWPARFEEILGPLGIEARRRLRSAPARDPGRHVKLRRIALETLSHLV